MPPPPVMSCGYVGPKLVFMLHVIIAIHPCSYYYAERRVIFSPIACVGGGALTEFLPRMQNTVSDFSGPISIDKDLGLL